MAHIAEVHFNATALSIKLETSESILGANELANACPRTTSERRRP